MSKSILVTGATGFVGRELTTLENDFHCVVRLGEAHSFENAFSVRSIDSSTDWEGCFDDVDSIIHLAGLAHSKKFSVNDYNLVNTAGTLRLAHEAAEAGVRRFVFVSSIGVNGTSTQAEPFTLDSEPSPHNDYARSKYDAEIGLKKIAKETGLEVVIVRPTLVYGPDAPGNFGMLTKLIKRLPVLPFGFATNRRDFISVQNLADLLVTCATHPNAAGHTFLASDGETVSIKEFTNAIAKGLDKKIFQLPVPVTLMRLAGKLTGKSAMIEQLYGNLEVDSSHIKEVLGWTPPFTMEQSMAFLKHTDK
ncbi:NAD-dependent epimerase/dehydratase family protein [Vibrio vulnificus]|uniref:NAD-dependent epimerase/dehydratase family protein n=1 Tax=Vibrio vulnificus TaxID=672 RepID=UPI000D3E735B|nr:NAD-dependent epimerase/dehydratase family protein [Vibrio vulnificus]PUZ81411.1 UDP-glucose 4-epimerase [Vibrio vulnificus]HAS6416302.1 NAD-dependent epimerase/dehydratase family protein [Vibrio vulnificus]HAS8537740.1 NAD-dependent epimerase/dehydratase family protein [Vibrio vulnificus]HDY7491593.1 NAD-dependent epimerase/dehydratase family protein [Vibrio vulnificus]HDY8002265.1 NAD-dependent epimerase/dehydratase family protein [Vibrio vulnificus]